MAKYGIGGRRRNTGEGERLLVFSGGYCRGETSIFSTEHSPHNVADR